MKKLLLSGIIGLAVAASVHGQGTINAANYENTDTSYLAASSGLFFWEPGVPMTDAIALTMNMELLGGSTAGGLTSLLTITDGSFYYAGVPGAYLDLNGTESTVAGVPKQGIGYFQVRVWLGSDADWASAVANGAVRVMSGIFQNPTGGDIPAPTLTGMPAMAFIIPEPGALSLFAVAGGLLLAARRRK